MQFSIHLNREKKELCHNTTQEIPTDTIGWLLEEPHLLRDLIHDRTSIVRVGADLAAHTQSRNKCTIFLARLLKKSKFFQPFGSVPVGECSAFHPPPSNASLYKTTSLVPGGVERVCLMGKSLLSVCQTVRKGQEISRTASPSGSQPFFTSSTLSHFGFYYR